MLGRRPPTRSAAITPFVAVLLSILVAALITGFLGYLAGLGGGMILSPTFVLYLGSSFGEAVGAAAIGVLAASWTTGAAFTRERIMSWSLT